MHGCVCTIPYLYFYIHLFVRQGQEAPFVIVSPVRDYVPEPRGRTTKPFSTFAGDHRRINVAVSRAREEAIVVSSDGEGN